MTRHVILLLSLLGVVGHAFAQDGNQFILKRYSPELSFAVMDSIHGAQTMIIEYPQFLVLVEMPLIDEGGGKARDLKEDTLRAKVFGDWLHGQYSDKQIKYILSSHWHLHSLSGVTPFARNGTKIITTKLNWSYALDNGLISGDDVNAVKPNIVEIAHDTTILSDTEFPIRILYLDSTYSNKPTKDYLFFYLEKQRYLHASCMAAVSSVDLPKTGSYVYHERLVDLNRLIEEKRIRVDKLIRLGRESFKNGQFVPGVYDYAAVEQYIKNGKSPQESMRPFIALSADQIQAQRDSILTELIRQNIPHFAINKAVYECIKNGEFAKALLFAQILALHSPGILDFIDTLGEAYFLNGNTVVADHISEYLFSRDPKWSGGKKVWEKNQLDKTY